jgi:capsular polysaccharide biosynthesis protein
MHRNFFLRWDGLGLKYCLPLFNFFHLIPHVFIVLYEETLEEYLITRFKHSKPSLKLEEDEIYLIIHHPFSDNYFHWICEAIPRLMWVKDISHEFTLLLPEKISNIGYVRESLLPFQLKNIKTYPDGTHFHVPKGIVPPIQKFFFLYNSKIMLKLRDLCHSYFISEKIKSPNRKIYITRRNSHRRKFENEEEVIRLMKSLRFEIIELENCSLKSQVQMFSEAKIVVSIHGAALSNLLFMQTNTTVVELYRKLFSYKSRIFKNLAKALSIKYHKIACNPVKITDSFYKGDLIADISAINRLFLDLVSVL